jgi:N-acetylglutamate synthase-like GNAT family acetyltransferase
MTGEMRPPGRAVEPTIRPAATGDADAIADLIRAMGYTVQAGHVRQRLAQLPSAQAVFVAVDRDGLVIGWVHVACGHSLIAGPRAEIAGLAVSQNQQRTGVGALLLGHAEQWAAQRGIDVVHLRSGTQRDGAHRFYRKQGYELVKSQYAFTKTLPGVMGQGC